MNKQAAQKISINGLTNRAKETMEEFSKRMTPQYLVVSPCAPNVDEWDVRRGSVLLGIIEAHEPDEAIEQAKVMFNKEVIAIF
jgi:hypothetical protein